MTSVIALLATFRGGRAHACLHPKHEASERLSRHCCLRVSAKTQNYKSMAKVATEVEIAANQPASAKKQVGCSGCTLQSPVISSQGTCGLPGCLGSKWLVQQHSEQSEQRHCSASPSALCGLLELHNKAGEAGVCEPATKVHQSSPCPHVYVEVQKVIIWPLELPWASSCIPRTYCTWRLLLGARRGGRLPRRPRPGQRRRARQHLQGADTGCW